MAEVDELIPEPEIRPARSPGELDYSLTPSNLEYQIRNLKLSIAAGENADPHSSPLAGHNPGALISPSTDLIGDRKRLVKLIQQRENWDVAVRPAWQAAVDEAYERRQKLINHARELVAEMPEAYRMDDGFVSLIESWCETMLATQKIDMAMKAPARQLGRPWNAKRLMWPFGGGD